MIRRARSHSSEETGGISETGVGSAAAKRKLSTSETQRVLKKTKKESGVKELKEAEEDITDAHVPVGDSDKDADNASEEEDDIDSPCEEDDEEDYLFREETRSVEDDPDDKTYKIDGPGPYVFYLWAEAMDRVLRTGHCDDVPYFVLKSAATDAYEPIARRKSEAKGGEDEEDEGEGEEDEDPAEDVLDIVRTWRIVLVKDAAKTPQGKALQRVWKKLERESHARGESCGDKGWWYEVLCQREKPEEGAQGLEIKLEGMGTWWIVDIQPTDDKGNEAMTYVVDFTCTAYD